MKPEGMSKRAWKRLNRDAERRGAIILPRDEARLARLPIDPRDAMIRDALARVDASLARSRNWINEREMAFAEKGEGDD